MLIKILLINLFSNCFLITFRIGSQYLKELIKFKVFHRKLWAQKMCPIFEKGPITAKRASGLGRYTSLTSKEQKTLTGQSVSLYLKKNIKFRFLPQRNDHWGVAFGGGDFTEPSVLKTEKLFIRTGIKLGSLLSSKEAWVAPKWRSLPFCRTKQFYLKEGEKAIDRISWDSELS